VDEAEFPLPSEFFGISCLRGFINAAVTAAFFTLATGFIDFGGLSAREEARR
jgi:hypothetical protein